MLCKYSDKKNRINKNIFFKEFHSLFQNTDFTYRKQEIKDIYTIFYGRLNVNKKYYQSMHCPMSCDQHNSCCIELNLTFFQGCFESKILARYYPSCNRKATENVDVYI